ncbi:MAG: lysophospholipid acyltransferase family protein [Solirubrobacterales bacterium]
MRQISRTYSLAMHAFRPLGFWSRLQVEGLEALPATGPVLLVGNHDSQWDPIMVGLAARRRRQILALAKSSLWEKPGLAPILDAMDQIPIDRSGSNPEAVRAAIARLRGGACVGVFAEGTVSTGRRFRARSGVGRLALEVPEARIVLVAVTGVTDIVRFPRRPRVRAVFFEPGGGQAARGEDPGALATRLVDELREVAPPVPHGRDAGGGPL